MEALGGQERPGQIAMAEAVSQAMEQRRHLLVQAGTGTGKSLAYLAPIVASGRKTVIATATKALQALALSLLDDHMAHCLVDAARQGGAEQEEKLKEASAAIARLVKS